MTLVRINYRREGKKHEQIFADFVTVGKNWSRAVDHTTRMNDALSDGREAADTKAYREYISGIYATVMRLGKIIIRLIFFFIYNGRHK